MTNRIISYETEISNAGQAVLKITLKNGIKETVVFEPQDIDNFASVCAMLNHPIILYDKIQGEPYFYSKSQP